MPFTVQQLIENNKPVTVYDNDPVKKAQNLMVEHRFSQLPVINEQERVLGLITSDSILRALNTFGVSIEKLRVLDAMDEVKRTFREDDDLFNLLDDLIESNAVLVVDGARKLVGIVTTADTTEYFRRRAEDMMYAEDIESMLKEYINAYFMTPSGQMDLAARDKAVEEIDPTKPFDKLVQNQYIMMFLHPSRWPRLQFLKNFIQ